MRPASENVSEKQHANNLLEKADMILDTDFTEEVFYGGFADDLDMDDALILDTNFTEEFVDAGFVDDLDVDDGLMAYLQAHFPEFFPSLPNVPEGNHVSLVVPNPFVEASAARYSTQRTKFTLPEDGAVDGHIKFRRIRSTDNDDENANRPPAGSLLRPSLAVHQRSVPSMKGDTVAYLPPDFGSGCKLDATDTKLLKFCKSSVPSP